MRFLILQDAIDQNVTVEEIVDDFGPRSSNAVFLPEWTVSAIVVAPGESACE